MNSPNNNTQPQQPSQNPQGQNTYQQQPGQFSQQSAPQGQQPGQYAQPQGYPQQAAPQAQPQPYNAMPQGAPGTPPAPPPAMGAAQAAGVTAAKAGMTLGAKIGIAAASVVAVAGLAVAGVFLLPGLLGSAADASAPPAQSVADGAGAGGSPGQFPADAPSIGFPVESHLNAQEIDVTVDGETYSGTYEGGYVNGQFNGYGVWEYDRIRYEGYFENGIPNGQGTLFLLNRTFTNERAGTIRTGEQAYEGTWINGLLDGAFTFYWTYDDGEAHQFELVATNGIVPAGETTCVLCGHPLTLTRDILRTVTPWGPEA